MNDTQAAKEAEKIDHPQKKVQVTVDGKPREVRPGTYVVSEFKKEVRVDPSLELDQVIDGQFIPLDNNASIEIKGKEVFVSHVPQGGSS
ncbi:MAG TPA: hypothetical protein VL332_04730 [Candidatus Saccharimonadaceae bacterium]|jgi:hypothetical protein|nr:hypothetical protein [Candidatus Saccharimonadaceae bacterium]